MVSVEHSGRIPVRYIPLLAGLLPASGFVLSYIISAANSHVPWCIPVMQGCTTISATGRLPPESLFFKGTMNIAAVVIILYWYVGYLWLLVNDNQKRWSQVVMLWLGILSGVFLIVYTTALGHIDPAYRVQRRIGVTVFFLFGYVAQIIQLNAQWRIRKIQPDRLKRIPLVIQTLMLGVMLLLGAANFIFHYGLKTGQWIDNIIEWNFALCGCAYYLANWFAWRSSNLCMQR